MNPTRTIALALLAAILHGCGLFVSHYDQASFQYFTSLKAYHVKFMEDYTDASGKSADTARAAAACDTGDLKFREAIAYAVGRQDKTRVDALTYPYESFKKACGVLGGRGLFSPAYAKGEMSNVILHYDAAIRSETARVGGPKN